MKKMKVLMVSGGSGGHLTPAMALAGHLSGEGRCFLVSTRRPVDRILSEEGGGMVEWETVGLQPFTPVWRWFSPLFVAQQMKAAAQVRSIIGRAQPDVVVGFGGYLSAVGVLAARRADIPVVIHEQNVLPGQANRWLARLADTVAVSFPETARHLPKRAAVETTGNPIRLRAGGITAEEARTELGLDPRRPVLLVMGGSQGSRTINRAVAGMCQGMTPQAREGIQLLHLTGLHGFTEMEQLYRRLGVRGKVLPFLHRMECGLAAATLAISRAGATAIAEMAEMRVPSILVPYPHAGGHQRANAHWMQEAGGAIVIEEGDLSPDRLRWEVERLLRTPERLEGMRNSLRGRSDGLAVSRLADLVRRVGKK